MDSRLYWMLRNAAYAMTFGILLAITLLAANGGDWKSALVLILLTLG